MKPLFGNMKPILGIATAVQSVFVIWAYARLSREIAPPFIIMKLLGFFGGWLILCYFETFIVLVVVSALVDKDSPIHENQTRNPASRNDSSSGERPGVDRATATQ